MVSNGHIDPQYECSAYSQLAELYLAKGDRKRYGDYLELCVNTARKNNLLRLYPESLKKLSDYYQQLGNQGKALSMRNIYWSIRDSIYNDRSFDIVKNEQFMYEINKYEQAISNLHQEQEQKEHVIHRQRMTLATAILFVLLVSGFSIYIYRTKQRLNKSYRNLYLLNKSLIREYHADRIQTSLSSPTVTDNGAAMADNGAAVKPKERYKKSNLTEKQKQQLLKDIQDVMEHTEAFCSKDFSLDKLAELVKSNSRYVSQVINECFDKNFTSYVNDFRVNLAKIRLADFDSFGNYTIKAIGESVGFKSQTSFTNIFKAMTGMTPAIYQKMARQEHQSAKD
jgi:YesN/AraC family two-component response regulator